MTSKSRIITFILVVFLHGACSSSNGISNSTTTTSNTTSGIPNWVNDPTASFSESRYLMAVGSGDTFDDARSRAFGNLTQIFRSNISGSQELISEFTESEVNNDGFTSNETTQLLNNIRIGSNEALMNTEVLISDSGNDGRYYVLVGMNRSESYIVYTNEISSNTTRIESLREGSMNTESVFEKLSLTKSALLLAKVNDNLARQLDVINPGRFDRSVTTENLTLMTEEMNEITSEATVSIVSNSDSIILRDAVAMSLQNEGFSITNANESVIQLQLLYNANEATLNRDDAKFVSWELSISISESSQKKTYQTFTQQGRDGALSLSDAYRRAELTAAGEIEKQFSTFLNSELISQN